MKKLSFIVLATLVLSACNSRYASNGETVYLQSHNGVKVVVPPPLTQANISNFYNLPPQNQDARVSIVPPGEDITNS
ncbi:hypothetical protein [Legionella worsleiensis]|uniref:Outer membrane protein assembly factor BamC n=1 Tax=Legionella worsleiensis TaxID=45076 RepID=A0A0W1AHD3_9GAMM|nr:hypothetical protein [Legionella worsleiensis]KTD80732.1 hypothetical protein Lwor_0975 [Legionella worsleiensis]STY32690.1 Uncharacterised protein [Legionella worsleiensis]